MTDQKDTQMATALQEYMMLHKRRSSYSQERSPPAITSQASSSSSTSSTPTTTPSSSPLSPPSPGIYGHSHLHSQHNHDQTRRRTSYSFSNPTSPAPITEEPHRDPAMHDEIAKIDHEILEALSSLLQSRTAKLNTRFREWALTRLRQKERDMSMSGS